MKPKFWGIISGCIFGFLTLIGGTVILDLILWGLWEVGVREIGGIKNNSKTMMPIAIGISAFLAIIVGILAGRFFYWWRQNRGIKPKSDRLFSPKTFGIFSGCSFGLLTFLFGTPLLVYIPIYLWDVRPLEFKENLPIAIGISAFIAIIVGILAGRFFYWWRQNRGIKPKSDRLFSPKTFGIFSGCSFGLLTFLFGTPLLVYISIYLWDVRPLEFKENLLIAIGISAFLAIILGILAGRFFYWWR